MVSSSEGGDPNPIRKLLGLGFWVQGFRCFPLMALNFFLKDGLNVDSSALQLLLNSSNFPMVAKPLYGIVSDAVYINGQHRIPYIAVGALLQALSWLAIAIISPSSISIFTVTVYLLLSNLGASIAEVANDAIVAEFFITVTVLESSLNLPKSKVNAGIRKQLSQLSAALRKPEIAYSITWFAASYAIIPALTGTMFFYQTQYLKIDSSVLGLSKVFGQAAMLLWSFIYNRHLKTVPPRKLISAIQALMAVFMISDVLFVKGFYKMMGVPDAVYVVIFSGLLEVLFFFKILPFSVLMARFCPPGCEGSLMAFVMSAIALAFIVSGFLGVALASYVGVTGDQFSGFPLALLIQAMCTVLPIYWLSYVPDDLKFKSRTKKE